MTRRCERCGSSFDAPPSARGRFCSHACYAGPRVECECGHCGEQFSISPSAATSGEGKFCSRSCYGLSLRRGSGYVHTHGTREHRLVAEQVLGRPLATGEVVHHRNGDRRDNRPENLEVLASQSEHMRQHPPSRGASHHSARLTQAQADEIRRRAADGEIKRHLAHEFGVSPATVSAITRGRRYINEPLLEGSPA